jgi:hypothetical protein
LPFRLCLPFWYLFLIGLVLSLLFTSTLYRLEPLCLAGFSLDRVAPCIHRCRFPVSSALPSLLLWVLPTSHNALVCLSRQVIAHLPVSLRLIPVTQKRVGCWISVREDVMRPPSVTQESIHNHLDCDHPSNHYLLKLPFAHGMSHHTKATYSSLVVSSCGYRY